MALWGQTRQKEIKKKKKKDVLLFPLVFLIRAQNLDQGGLHGNPALHPLFPFFWESWMEGWHRVLAIPALQSSPRDPESPVCCR